MTCLKAVLFDLDGTLVDSVPGIHQAVNAVLEETLGATCSEEDVRHWIGNGPARLIERALLSRRVGMDAIAGLKAFRTHYAKTLYNAHCYPGVREGLARLEQAGLKLACITNKSSVFTGPFLKHMGLDGHFEAVLCGDEVDHPKPHPESLAVVCGRLGVEAEEALMVGDSINDLLPAKELGMASVAVSYGYHQNQPLADYGPRLVTEDFTAVIDYCLQRVDSPSAMRTQES